MVQVLIGIIVLAIILYGSVFIFQQVTTRRVRSIQEHATDLTKLGVDQQVAAGRNMSLTGQSLAAFNELAKTFRDVDEKQLPALNKLLDKVLHDVRGINFVKTRREQKQAEAMLTTATDQLDHVQQGIDELKKVDGEHRAAVERLEKKYQDLRKVLLSQNLSFGPSIDKLEQNLANLEEQFDQFTTLSNQGDHVAAQEVLDQLTTGTTELENLIEVIPGLYADLKSGFNDQLTDITDGYQQLAAQNYVFGDIDLPGQVNRIRTEIQASTRSLANVDVAEVATTNHNIETQIDDLYAVLEKEVKAKPQVDEQRAELQEFVDHAQRQNHALQVELDRLSQSYLLNHGELDNAQSLGDQIHQVVELQQTDENALVAHTNSFSNIEKHQSEQLQTLTQIEQDQRQINDAVRDLPQQEKAARDRFQRFDNQLHTIKRQLEGMNLPGLPKDYLDYFYVVSDEVEKLGGALSQTQINMEDITKQLVMIQADIATLDEKSTDLRDSALLAEQMLQYANRYRDNEDMSVASAHAQHLFDKEFQYATALEIMANALETVEPGAYQRLENNYYGTTPKD